ncbi:MAG: hypothetical protein IPL62_07795 [Caulobacteraceae bacterium]|nr:hypothetical protein [Caulobacteraceae bacterium]
MFDIRPAPWLTFPRQPVLRGRVRARCAHASYLFQPPAPPPPPASIRAGIETFFAILLRARIALAMPADVLDQNGEILGAIMGYDTSRPSWPTPLTEEWDRFEASVPGFTGRLPPAYEDHYNAHHTR